MPAAKHTDPGHIPQFRPATQESGCAGDPRRIYTFTFLGYNVSSASRGAVCTSRSAFLPAQHEPVRRAFWRCARCTSLARAAGCLALPTLRDAFLTALAKASLPPRVVATLDEILQTTTTSSPVSLSLEHLRLCITTLGEFGRQADTDIAMPAPESLF